MIFFMTSQPLSSFGLGYSQVMQAASAQPHPQQLRFSLHFQSVCMSPLAGQSVLSAVHPVLPRRECRGTQSSFPTCIRIEFHNLCVYSGFGERFPQDDFTIIGRLLLLLLLFWGSVSKEHFSRLNSNMGIHLFPF